MDWFAPELWKYIYIYIYIPANLVFFLYFLGVPVWLRLLVYCT